MDRVGGNEGIREMGVSLGDKMELMRVMYAV